MTPPLTVSLGACWLLKFPFSVLWWYGNTFLHFSCAPVLGLVLGVIPACVGGKRLTPGKGMEQVANCRYCKLLQNLPESDSPNPFFFFLVFPSGF